MTGYRTPEIRPYDPAWATLYATEAAALRPAIPGLLALEHIGSTSVPGLAAKPIVDILAVVPDAGPLTGDHAALAALDYDYRPAAFADDPMHLFFAKDIAGRRAVHLHVFAEPSPYPAENLRFRDYLRASAPGRVRYADGKRAIAAVTSTRGEYAMAKEPLMAELTLAVDAWEAAGRPAE